METIQMSSKGQIVIPAETRHRLGLSRGDRLTLFERDDEIVIKPIVKLSQLRGKYKIKNATEKLMEMRKEDLEMEKSDRR